ncbi:HAD-IC family P-type ATPase [Candidatus Solirubrobacter pratensis]|uniref:HAD-IC family P-type ATPase n=1 Tax=Candidatus Solirubrobacter pratensis TaxID=1298857 RepID=UPI0012DF2D79|nr:HAD-IC family P-type ATPase [Candidatus Solirubrobacter pratensis]
MERALGRLRGVREVRASATTGNVLVHFEEGALSHEAILAPLAELAGQAAPEKRRGSRTAPAPEQRPAARRPAVRQPPPVARLRIAVRGLEADARMAERVVASLGALPGVRHVGANPLTARALVEFDPAVAVAATLCEAVAKLEADAGVAGAPEPREPVDAVALTTSATRAAAAALGLGLLLTRGLLGRTGAPVASAKPAVVAALVSVGEGVPPLRSATRSLVGDRAADTVLPGAGLAAQTLSGKTLGLAVAVGSSFRALTALRARASAWTAHEDAAGEPVAAGSRLRLRGGDRARANGVVLEGAGTAIGPDGLPSALVPGAPVEAGARVSGGPFVIEARAPDGFSAGETRPSPPAAADVYAAVMGVAAIGAAAAVGFVTRSPGAALVTLQLLTARPSLHGRAAADHGAAARVVRAGVTVVGTRPERRLRRPDVVLVHEARLLADGIEVERAVASGAELSASEVIALAGEVATAAGSPWGPGLAAARARTAQDAGFDGSAAAATIDGRRYRLEARRHPGVDAGADGFVLVLECDGAPAGALVLRPRLAAGARVLADACARFGARLALLRRESTPGAAHALAERAEISLLDADDAPRAVRALQRSGARVAVVADGPAAGAAFHACDLAIGVTGGRGGAFGARADLLAPDLAAVAATIEAGARAGRAERDGVALSLLANVVGAVWGLRTRPTVVAASRPATMASAAALALAWLRLQGGGRARATVGRLTDPRPERWGHLPAEAVLRELGASADGLSAREAGRRRRRRAVRSRRGPLAVAVAGQLRSPANAILAGGALLSLSFGAAADVVMIAAVIAANTLIEAWQQQRAGRAAEALQQLTAPEARVLRDGRAVTVAAEEVVPGDVLVLAPGDRVAADARVLSSHGLQVDEAALTGESMPVAKGADNGTEDSRIVLEGSDVTVGTGRAVAVAVGSHTRLGSIAAALDVDDDAPSPLAVRLERMMRQGVPVVAGAGAVVAGAGLLRGRSLATQLPLGASMAIAAVPEGLQLLATVSAAGVARRLAARHALVRSLPAVDALGRVDVACADKTGTLTVGRPAVRVVADLESEARPQRGLQPPLRDILRTAAHASPHPDASGAGAHPTDVAVLEAAEKAELGDQLRARREREWPFDPARSFHAAVADGRLCVKGAVEALTPRCRAVRRGGEDEPLTDAAALLARADSLAAQGLRVLLVAEGPASAGAADPRELTALGFVGIADPLRAGTADALRRCREAGVRVLMLTGDHPTTARAIAREAGLPVDDGAVVTGPEIAELGPVELDRRLARATVAARITPLDKLRIVESLQRRGHTVAMTGDGVNDAPALRLADVGVAMGRGGTEVARQAADVILTEDDVRVFTEALVEGRGFWRNMRRALALLLGGNLGEVGLLAGAAILGLPSPLTARQILAMNLVTDVLPAVAVAMQPPEHRRLSALAREGAEALDRPLRRDILNRAATTAPPSLAAYAVALRRAPAGAGSVAFGSICATQLALTIADGRTDGGLSAPVAGAVVATGALLAAMLGPLRAFLGFGPLGPAGWGLIGAATLGTAALTRAGAPLHGTSP